MTNLFTANLLEKIYKLQKAYSSYTNFSNYSHHGLSTGVDNWYQNKTMSNKFDGDFMYSKDINKIEGLNLTEMYLNEIEAMDNNGGAGLYLRCNYQFDENMRIVEDKVNYKGRSLKGANFNKALRVALEVRASQQAYPFYRYTGNGEYEANPNFTVDKVFDTITTELSKIKQRTMAKGKLVLSANPLDYLTMSENKNNWSSCHALDGCHAAGTLAYMQDAHSFVAYLTSNEDVKLFENNGESFYWNSKQWRAMVYVKPGVGFTIQTHYPFKSVVLQQEVVEMVKEAFFADVELIDTTGFSSMTGESTGPVYIDSIECSYAISTDLSYSERRIQVGESVYCHECGSLHYEGDTDTDAWVCCGCGGYFCDFCGERDSEDYMTWIESADQCVCEYCRDKHYQYCEDCHEWLPKEDVVEVHTKGPRSGTIFTKEVCTDCIQGGCYVICDDCEEVFDLDTINMFTDKNGESFCPDCAERLELEDEEEE